LTYELTILS